MLDIWKISENLKFLKLLLDLPMSTYLIELTIVWLTFPTRL